jgi:hypothetical protein
VLCGAGVCAVLAVAPDAGWAGAGWDDGVAEADGLSVGVGALELFAGVVFGATEGTVCVGGVAASVLADGAAG